MHKRVLMIIGIMILSLLVFAGCGGKGQSNPSSEKGSANKQETQTSSKGIRVGVVVKALNSDYWRLVEAGAKEAGNKLGIEVTVLGPAAETQVTEQVSMIEDLITKKVSALAVAPSQPSSAIPAFEHAKAQNIPVVLIDTDAKWDGKVSFVGTGNYVGGKQAGEFLAKKLGKGAKIAILRGALGDPTHDERANGAIEVLKAEGLEVVTVQPANSERQMGMTVMENILQANPGIQGVFATNDEMALGALRAIEAAKKNMVVVGFDGSPDALKSIKEGKLTASIAQNPYNIGYMGVDAAVKAAKGESVEKRIDTGTKVITKENVDEEQTKLAKILGNR
ncbi:sugar ABC transporter substrate-binding protein [Moorella naiadis]|uniref:sugar ABC transporter substrate-binding protein n=1 Tax=Moorella naiadis (nom. illeg.) TaxID=3093670 RepID=UPI003D9C87AF